MKTERHEGKEGKTSVGANESKGNQRKGDKPMTVPNLIEKPVAEALFVCKHAAREKGKEG